MTLIYYYDDGSKQTVNGKSERDCAEKMKSKDAKIIRVERHRSILEKVTG